jgi:hypothetical protein
MSGFQTLAGHLTVLAAEEGGGGVEFPPIDLIVKWPFLFGEDTWYGFNKIGLISLIAMIVPVLFFFFAGRKASAVPGKLQNLAETAIDFVEKQVILPAIGKEGMRYLPMLTARSSRRRTCRRTPAWPTRCCWRSRPGSCSSASA